MQSYVPLWYLTEFYLEWEMVQTNFVEKKPNTRFILTL